MDTGHHAHAGRLLGNLFAAARPAIAAVIEQADFQAAAIGDVVVQTGAPIVLRVPVIDTDGREHVFVGEPFGDVASTLARALGDVVTHGLNQLPAGRRPQIAADLDAGGSIVMVLDKVFAQVRASIVRDDTATEIFVLAGGNVH